MKITVANLNRDLNVLADPPDIRDRVYQPALLALRPRVDRPVDCNVLDQGQEGSCTGFGLAAVIDQLLRRQQRPEQGVSARMLYEMAKHHDEWPGHEYAGSSCRGAIQGWKNMGVCSVGTWPHRDLHGGLTVRRAIEARRITLGAYYRLRPEVVDYHAAINEVGAVYCSAQVHDGWKRPIVRGTGDHRYAVIKPYDRPRGGHAFAIVGYDEDGFWVQNSWGPQWGVEGVARWLYEDWSKNVSDGWVVQLALPTPQIFGRQHHRTRDVALGDGPDEDNTKPFFGEYAPKRLEIAGHFVHFDDGSFKRSGNYWSNRKDVRQTAEQLAESTKYDSLLIYVHGGLNSPKASARRIQALKDGFKRNRVYPFHIMYDTGLTEEITDVVKRGWQLSQQRAGGFTDWTDAFIEWAVRKPGTALWEEMKRDARLPFQPKGDGSETIREFASRLAKTTKAIHMAGHSTGGIALGHLLSGLEARGVRIRIKTMTLFAPACRLDFFNEHYLPCLRHTAKHVYIDKLTVYNLTDEFERDDQVAGVYRKSLLYLVSRAFERGNDVPLLGMSQHSKPLSTLQRTEFIYSGERRRRSRSATHGGFDNDRTTMNNLLNSIMGQNKVLRKFTQDEMGGY